MAPDRISKASEVVRKKAEEVLNQEKTEAEEAVSSVRKLLINKAKEAAETAENIAEMAETEVRTARTTVVRRRPESKAAEAANKADP